MILALDCGSSKFPDIIHSLKEAGANVLASKAELVVSEPENISGIVISGSPFLLSKENSPLVKSLHWITGTKKPVLGICFGHQLLGMLYGGEVYLGPPDREPVSVNITIRDPLFNQLPDEVEFAQDHTEGLVVPDNVFEVLASSEQYPVEAVRHKEKVQYGVQFHPEVSGEPGQILFNNFLKLCRGF